MVLLLLIFLGGSFGSNVLGAMIGPVFDLLQRVISFV